MAGRLSQRHSSIDGHAACVAYRPAHTVVVAALIVLLLSAIFAAFPLSANRAYAASYTYSHVNISAQVQTDATVRVVEHRVLSFTGDCNQYQQEQSGLQSNQQLVINNIRIAPADAEGNVIGEWQRLSPVAFQTQWRTSVPSDQLSTMVQAGSYSYDLAKQVTHLYFSAKAGDNIVIEYDYSIVNGAQAYKDVSEVTMKFVSDSFEADSHDVTFTVSLPVPGSTQAKPNENVYAWCHGPADGTFDNQGDAVVYTDELVKAGQYAEARIVFPSSWLTHLSGSSSLIHRDEMHLSSITQSEKVWQDRYRNGAISDDLTSIVLVLIAALVLIASLVVCSRFGKDLQPSMDTSADNLASRGRELLRSMHPAVVARLLASGMPTDREFALTVMDLCNREVLELSSTKSQNDPLADQNDSATHDTALFLTRASYEYFDNEADNAAIAVFESVLDNEGKVTLPPDASVSINKTAFFEAIRVWDVAVAHEFDAQEFIDQSSVVWGKRLRNCGIVLLVLALITFVATTCWLAVPMLVIAALAVFVVSAKTKRLTQKAVDDRALFDAYAETLMLKDAFDQREILDLCVLGLRFDSNEKNAFCAVADVVEQSIPLFFKEAHRRPTKLARLIRYLTEHFTWLKRLGNREKATK